MTNPSTDTAGSPPTVVANADEDAEELVERLAAEMASRWQKGERPVVEDYLSVHPHLAERAEAAVELVYQEVCLRQEYGQPTSVAEVLQRFPRWREPLRIVLECHQLLESHSAPPQFPAEGESLAGFRLLTELGRGTQGRVFLAVQSDLADRPMVLKLVARTGGEHLSLARVQHTNIVPLYSVCEDPARNLRALCMPYFGGMTVAALLDSLRGIPHEQRLGKHIVDALAAVESNAALSVPEPSPARSFLTRISYARGIAWLGVCLADALHYAHERGLLHLDLKPSNVLWAADGQPMLLDFHLAREPILAGASPPARFGGTPAYMAPEQREALDAVRRHQSIPTDVDARADVFALGKVLAEALGGRRDPSDLPARRVYPPHVGAGLSSILDKCLAAAPKDRYASAAEVSADLRRHLADMPLRGVPNRSWIERWQKWRRRRPQALPLLGLLLFVTVAAVGLGLRAVGRLDEAQRALAEGERLLHQGSFREAHGILQRSLSLVENLPFNRPLTEQLSEQMHHAARAEAAEELHRVVERVRVLYGVDSRPPGELQAIEAHCRALWDQRTVIAQRLAPASPPGQLPQKEDQEEQVRTDLLDLAVLWTNLRLRVAAEQTAQVRRDALEILAQAEALYGPSPVLARERQVHAQALGFDALALEAGRQADALPVRTAWEHYALGRTLFQAGRLEAALGAFDRALDLQPQGLWLNFQRGRCAFELKRFDEAVAAFSACIALAPQIAGFVYNRGLALAETGHLESSLRDYDRAIRLDSTLHAAVLNRGLMHYRLKHYDLALADLKRALEQGADPATVHFNAALVHVAREDRHAAATSLRLALQHNPNHREALQMQSQLGIGR